MRWYNLRDKMNYKRACYVIITETDVSRSLILIDELTDAMDQRVKLQETGKYVYLSEVMQTNLPTYQYIFGLDEDNVSDNWSDDESSESDIKIYNSDAMNTSLYIPQV